MTHRMAVPKPLFLFTCFPHFLHLALSWYEHLRIFKAVTVMTNGSNAINHCALSHWWMKAGYASYRAKTVQYQSPNQSTPRFEVHTANKLSIKVFWLWYRFHVDLCPCRSDYITSYETTFWYLMIPGSSTPLFIGTMPLVWALSLQTDPHLITISIDFISKILSIQPLFILTGKFLLR